MTLGSAAGTEPSTHRVHLSQVKLEFCELGCAALRSTGNTCLYLKCSQGRLYQPNTVIKERAPASSLGVTCGQQLAESIREIKPISAKEPASENPMGHQKTGMTTIKSTSTQMASSQNGVGLCVDFDQKRALKVTN